MVQMSGGVQLELQDLSYESDQFVNRVIEYDIDKFLGVAWENNKFIFIDHQKEKITDIVPHPKPNQKMRCWGLQKVADFDKVSCPFIIARDNSGLVLVNIKTKKTYFLMSCTIQANLFGGGDILRIMKDQETGG